MDTFNSSQCRNPATSTDPNNNSSLSMKGYSLRPRTARRCEEEDEPLGEPEVWRPTRNKRKQKSLPLSKYRRKTANARERSRMKEINDAFETLRRVIPHMSARDCTSEKLTKITTLRLAMKYIAALNTALQDHELESDGDSLLSDYTLTPPDHFITSPVPSLVESTLASDLFSPLLIGTSQAPDIPGYSGTPLSPVDPDITELGNSSYVFEDTIFLSDFS